MKQHHKKSHNKNSPKKNSPKKNEIEYKQEVYQQQISSCNCYGCKASDFDLNMQTPKNCDTSPYFDCVNTLYFKTQVEPANKKGYEFINPENISNAYATDFHKHKDIYKSNDPRLISGAHNGQVLELDRPPTDHHIKLCDIYSDPNMVNFGKQHYYNYEDIKAGDILYYNDKSIEDSLFHPVFENPAIIESKLYKDPMSGIAYPEYVRTPILNDNLLKTKNRKYRYGSSYINDTNEFREDIIHLQMRPQDRTRYMPRWAGELEYKAI